MNCSERFWRSAAAWQNKGTVFGFCTATKLLEEFAGRSNNKLSNGEAGNIKIGKRIVRYAAQRSKYFFRTERPEVIIACFAVAPPGASKMAQAEMNVAKNPAQSASCRESTVDFRVS